MDNRRARTRRATRGPREALFVARSRGCAGGLDLFAEKQRTPFKRLLEESLQQVLEGQMTDFLGAAPGKHSRTRSGHRDGHRDRELVSSMGAVRLRVPRDRARQFSTELFDRYPRVGGTVLSALATLHLQGASVARVNGLIETLCGRPLSSEATAQVAAGIRAALARFADRPLETRPTRLIVESRRTRIRLDGVVRTRTILLATGVDAAGRHELLAVNAADAAARTVTRGLLRRLRGHGLRGIEVVFHSAWKGQRLPAPARLGLPSRTTARRARWGGAAAPGNSLLRWPSLLAVDVLASRAPDAPSQAIRAQPAIALTEPAPVALQPPASDLPVVLGTLAPGPAFTAGFAGADAATLAEEPRVVWVRRGVEKELSAKRPRHSARSPSKLPWLVGGSSVALVALAAGVWVFLHLVGTSPEPKAAVAASAAYEAPRPVFFTTPNLATPSAQPGTHVGQSALPLRLTGVIAAKSLDGSGIALIAVGDGRPNPFRVGARVDQDLVVKAVRLDRVQLGPVDGPATLELELNAAGPIVAAVSSPLPTSGGAGPTASDRPEPRSPEMLPPIGVAPPAPVGVRDGTVIADASGAQAVVDPLELVRQAEYRDDASRASARRAHMFRRTAAR